ncbi:D-alanyl-D-alanine endopeptidase [Aurantivibrio infirmus]
MRVRELAVVRMLKVIFVGSLLLFSSIGYSEGLDPAKIQLGSVRVSIFDPTENVTLYSKNAHIPGPIASITKLMTAMVVLDANQPLDELITILTLERKSGKNAYSRMRVGAQISRGDLIRLALMASENLAASSLADNYPGGFEAFIQAMNKKAEDLGMHRTRFVDASGLSIDNVSTASDLTLMLVAAYAYEQIKEFTTTGNYTARFKNPRHTLGYGNTNRLVHRQSWKVKVSKTGYLDEAGRCLVMISEIEGKPVAMVLLDSFGKMTPIGDAGRVKRWITTGNSGGVAGAARDYERRKSAEISSYKSVQN